MDKALLSAISVRHEFNVGWSHTLPVSDRVWLAARWAAVFDASWSQRW
jgi:hypothetical protein